MRLMKTALALIGLALLAVGPAALLAPKTAALAFGIPANSAESRAYLLATAMRDVAMGGWLLAILGLRAHRRVLAASVAALTLVAAADATNVCITSGLQSYPALVVHVGAVFMLLPLGWYLWQAGID